MLKWIRDPLSAGGFSSSLQSVTLSREKRASRTKSLAVYSCTWRVRLTAILLQTNPDESPKMSSQLKISCCLRVKDELGKYAKKHNIYIKYFEIFV